MLMTVDLTIRETAGLSGVSLATTEKLVESHVLLPIAGPPRVRGRFHAFSARAGRGVFSRPQGVQSDRPSPAPQAVDLGLHDAARADEARSH